MTRERLSVLIPVHAAADAEATRRCFNTVAAQTRPADEWVVVLDGPVGQSLELALGELHATAVASTVLVQQRSGGLGMALQMGLEACSGDLVARMDADDLIVPERFAKQTRMLREQPELDLVGSYVAEFEADPSSPCKVREVPTSPEGILRFARYRNPVNHMTVMFRREAALAAGGYQVLPGFEDYWLWIRMMALGSRFANIPECLVVARADDAWLARRGGWRYFRNELELLRRARTVGFMSTGESSLNMACRAIYRFAPSPVRGRLYELFLRRRRARIRE